MKQRIISQMRAELYDTNLCRNDFEKYDVPALENETEPFFWMVRRNGTAFVKLGVSEIIKWFAIEHVRFSLFREPQCYIDSLLYYGADPTAKFFYWDGYILQHIKLADISKIFDNLTKPTWEMAVESHKEEYEMRNTPLEIKFASAETEKRFEETLDYAKSINDKTLEMIVHRLKARSRTAVVHYITISSDFTPHSYNFAEMVHENCCLNGGIIMHESDKHIHWQTHT